eukprot:3551613-Amphidinium_carterae.1
MSKNITESGLPSFFRGLGRRSLPSSFGNVAVLFRSQQLIPKQTLPAERHVCLLSSMSSTLAFTPS